jgi:hypothetical protein
VILTAAGDRPEAVDVELGGHEQRLPRQLDMGPSPMPKRPLVST